MRLASEGGVGLLEREAFRLFRLRKRIRQFLKYRPGCAKTVVFIVGCQRSGTSMLSHLFRLDPDCITYDEVSPLSSRDPEGLRLDPLPEVAARVDRDRAPLVVLKPLVESQNLPELLDAFPGSRAVWMFRHFHAVASSNLKFFGAGNGYRDLAPIAATEPGDWRSEKVSGEVSRTVKDALDRGCSDLEAAALFWWARNRLVFDLDLAADSRVRLIDYGRLLAEPQDVMTELYAVSGRPFPGPRIVADVLPGRSPGALPAGFDPVLADLCDGLYLRLGDVAARAM